MAGIHKCIQIRAIRPVVAGAALLIAVVALAYCNPAFASPPRYQLTTRFGPDGTSQANFSATAGVAVDSQTHAVYATGGNFFEPGQLFKFDEDGNPVDWTGASPALSGNELSGFSLDAESFTQVAVDSVSHTVYLTANNSVTAFEASGEPADFTAGSSAGGNAIEGFSRLGGIAIDSHGDIYASDWEAGEIRIFAPTGEQITEVSVEKPASLAVDSTGSLYLVRAEGSSFTFVERLEPSSYPVTAGTTYGNGVKVDPQNSAGMSQNSIGVSVDPSTDDLYVSHPATGLKGEGGGVAVYDESGNLVQVIGGFGSGGQLGFPFGVSVLGGDVYVANTSLSEDVKQVFVFRPEPPAAPAVEVKAAGAISSTSVTLYARINPNQLGTTYHLSYVPKNCAPSVCAAVPVSSGTIAAGNDGVWVSQKIQGLSPGAEYGYLIVAENALGAAKAEGSFVAQGTALGVKLADGRAWEMVSPPNKHGARLVGNLEGQEQAAVNGGAVVYSSRESIEAGPGGARFEWDSIVARHGASGWSSKDITTPNDQVVPAAVGQGGEYKLFSPDLRAAVLDQRTDTPLSPEASERGPYLRTEGEPPSFRPLATGKEGFANVPPGTTFGGPPLTPLSEVLFVDATPDLKHVLVDSYPALVEGSPADSQRANLYEWTDGSFQAVGFLPASEVSEGIDEVKAAGPGSGETSMRHAMSDDGSRVFWAGTEAPYKHLYMRDLEVGETVRIDVPQPGVGEEGEVDPVFQGASADGTIVYFTDTQRLTADAGLDRPDLYRCEVNAPAAGCTDLVDLTAPPTGASEPVKVLGLTSALSDDGSRIYFVAEGVLAAQANSLGQSPSAGAPDLYLWERGRGLRFIAALSREDNPDWGSPIRGVQNGAARYLGAVASPDGRYFGFLSERDLTGQGNVEVPSGESVEEVFRFDAQTGSLDCVSCSPVGAAPRGVTLGLSELVDPQRQWLERHVSATLPEPDTLSNGGPSVYRPRAVLDNGRVFFNSVDALVPADTNRQWDVYEYEDLGVGDCAAASGDAATARSRGGCVSLVSSGTGEAEAGFLDASTSGDDAFFLTPARLSATDVDDEVDVYDARVDGAQTMPNPKEECGSGDSCHPALPQAQFTPPASASFEGAGNVKPSRTCPKGKHWAEKDGKRRCVARRSRGKRGKKKHEHHRRAGQPKRVSR